MAKIVIELQVEDYDQLRALCDSSSAEYRLLMSACVDPRSDHPRAQNVITILCETGEAVELLDLASRGCDGAVKSIKRALNSLPSSKNAP